MPIVFKCPECEKTYRIADAHAGRVAGCGCGAKFRIPAPSVPEQSLPAEPEDIFEENIDSTVSPAEETAIDESSFDDFDNAEEPDIDEDDDLIDTASDDLEPDTDEKTEDDDTGVLSDDRASSEDDIDDEDDEFDEDESAEEQPKSWAGRILLLLGAGALAASLFLPIWNIHPNWRDLPFIPAQTQSSITINEPSVEVISADADADADTDAEEELEEETKAETKKPATEEKKDKTETKDPENAPKEAKKLRRPAEQVKGLDLITAKAKFEPLFYGYAAAIGLGIILAATALLGIRISGILGFVLTIIVIAGSAAGILGLLKNSSAGTDDPVALATQHLVPQIKENISLPGLPLFLGGTAAIFIGGLLCSMGVFKRSGGTTEIPENTASGRSSPRKPARKPLAPKTTPSASDTDEDNLDDDEDGRLDDIGDDDIEENTDEEPSLEENEPEEEEEKEEVADEDEAAERDETPLKTPEEEKKSPGKRPNFAKKKISKKKKKKKKISLKKKK